MKDGSINEKTAVFNATKCAVQIDTANSSAICVQCIYPAYTLCNNTKNQKSLGDTEVV